MTSKGAAWRRGAQAMAWNLWRDGKCFLSYQLQREVIKDVQLEAANQESKGI